MFTVSSPKEPIGKTEPQIALIFHGNKDSDLVNCVTKHPIKSGLIQAGTYVSPNSVISLLEHNKNETGLVYREPIVIAESHKTLVWYRPSEFRPMWFRTSKVAVNYHVMWPTLLFVADKEKVTLRVFALGSSNYPKHNATIYHAPLMNISTDGSVCQGSARLPEQISMSSIKEIESTIYDSNFTHVNHSKTLNLTDNNSADSKAHIKFWQTRKGIKRRIPIRFLNPTHTLSSLLDTLN